MSQRLWNGPAPGAIGDTPADIPALTRVAPTPGQAHGATLLILPGGAYGGLAEHEGLAYAEGFAAHGFTCYVLTYRLGPRGYRHPVMLADAARALRTVRQQARRDGLDPQRVVLVGSSAGGHLAATLLTRFDAGNPAAEDPIERESSRPDAAILCYPVINMGAFTHAASRANLLGADAPEALCRALSAEQQVTPETPPCFIWHTVEDSAVPVENALLFAGALRRAGVPFSLHLYEKGAHGLGLPGTARNAPPWDAACLHWLRGRGLMP